MKPIAVVCSDIHLCAHAPAARASEPDWFAAMAKPLAELRRTAKALGVPIVCAGDIFDKWDPPHELTNFAIEHLPEMYAVPGQHDLPYHIDEDMDKSAFGTLVRIGKVKLLRESPTLIKGAWLFGFGWGAEITPLAGTEKEDRNLRVAVVHAYCWAGRCSYKGAEESQNLSAWQKKLVGYDCAVFGDNHKGFYGSGGEGASRGLMNCGGFMRRRTDDATRNPMIGILYSDGSIRKHLLNTEGEQLDIGEIVEMRERDDAEIEDFVKRLSDLQESSFDFASALVNYIETHDVSPGVRKFILSSIQT